MRKGILLAGGTGSRLNPITQATNKHLLNVYDKPMFFYPLSTLMLAGIRDILIISSPRDIEFIKKFFKDGSELGMNISYEIQTKPEGIAQAFLIGEKFIGDNSVALILGDNIFHGNELTHQLKKISGDNSGAYIFAYPVGDPERYGVIEFSDNGEIVGIEEKPNSPKSKYAITGLYFYDKTVIEKAKKIKPSERGELEISSINEIYLKEGNLKLELMGRGMAWLDTGTFDSLHQASSYIRTLQLRQGFKIACPEEIAWRNKWINDEDICKIAHTKLKSGYGEYLLQLIGTK
jgi:glucose-1-phosphate thymidylyltransferase